MVMKEAEYIRMNQVDSSKVNLVVDGDDDDLMMITTQHLLIGSYHPNDNS